MVRKLFVEVSKAFRQCWKYINDNINLNNMAIIDDSKGIKTGHADGFVFRKVNGKMVAQAMPSQYNDAKSPAQQKQRSGMRNLLAFYRVAADAIRLQFNDEKGHGRPYNLFVGMNLKMPAVELPDAEYRLGNCILAPYIISYGKLTPLEPEVVDGCLRVEVNPESWRNGDILRLVGVESKGTEDGVPTRLSLRCEDLNIDRSPENVFTSEPLPHGAYTFVHIRRIGKKYQSSTQQLIII